LPWGGKILLNPTTVERTSTATDTKVLQDNDRSLVQRNAPGSLKKKRKERGVPWEGWEKADQSARTFGTRKDREPEGLPTDGWRSAI